MPCIIETIVTTMSGEGVVHIAPLGLIEDGAHWIIAPFKPSRTLENLLANPFAVASHTDDVRVFAGCLTGRRDWPVKMAATGRGVYLESALSHWELAVDSVQDDDQRPRFSMRTVHTVSHAPWAGFNRAQVSVLELAVLSTRLSMLPPGKLDQEIKYLEIAVTKTAGPRELEAWSWLMDRVDAWRRGDKDAAKKL